MAQIGPIKGTKLLEMSPVEYVHTLHLIRLIPANPDAWKKQSPKPEGWKDDQ